MKKIIFNTLLAIFSILIVSCTGKTDGETSATWETPEDTAEKAVEAVTVNEGSMVPEVRTSGIIRSKNEVWLISEAAGIVTEVRGIPGETIHKGDILLKIENRIPGIQKELAYQLYKAAKTDFGGIESSYKQGGISRSDYNNAYSNLLKKETDYIQAENDFEKRTVRAPFDGDISIFNTDIKKGSFINTGTRIAMITDCSVYYIETAVGERQAYNLEKGLKAEVYTEINGDMEKFDAVITAVGTGSDPETGSFQVIAEWENRGNFKILSGSSASLVFETAKRDRHIIIPSSALSERNSKKYVFTAEKGKALLREVKTGKRYGSRIIITEGLEKGEILITSGLNSLDDGSRVKVFVKGSSDDSR